MLAPGPWLIGPFSLADIAVALYLFRLAALGHDRFWSATQRLRVHMTGTGACWTVPRSLLPLAGRTRVAAATKRSGWPG